MRDRQQLLYFVGAALFFIVAGLDVADDGLSTKPIIAAVIGGALFALGLIRTAQGRR